MPEALAIQSEPGQVVTLRLLPPVVAVEVPLPARSLNPNIKADSVKAKISRHHDYTALRKGSMAAFKVERGRRLPLKMKRGAIRCCFFYAVKRDRDEDNLIAATKAARDGAQWAKVIGDDYDFQLLPSVVEIDRKRPRLVIEVFDVRLAVEVLE